MSSNNFLFDIQPSWKKTYFAITGTPQEKAKLMFDMYDLDKNGELDIDEFRSMLKYVYHLSGFFFFYF